MSETRFARLIDRIKEYNPKFNTDIIVKAYELAKSAHIGQSRASGEPFINHPLEVAYILADMEMDTATIAASLLHDTVEDTTTSIEEIEENFGAEIAMLVDGMTKLSQFTFSTKEEQQAENLRKMLLAMAKDIRVIVIKLADRLHNMRTLRYKSEGKQLEKARETMDIYAPLAHRLGISKIKWELEDLALWYLDPEGYYELVDSIAAKRREREAFIESTKLELEEKIKEIGIEDIYVDGRAKHFYSIYRKMKRQDKTIDQIYDLFAFRIIVNTVQDCYAILGLVHELYKPMPGRFKDYIAMPKPNMYQSLHTTLMGREGNLFEVQIRTWDMHRTAEVGIAAHWKYKEGSKASGDNADMDNKLAWVRQLLETQNETHDAHEFMENLKVDLFTDEVFVFTPNGDVINLPNGACPIDFAYAIHSAVGNKTVGAKANGRMVTLNYELQNGDIVEILTSGNSQRPSRDWLKIVKSAQARNKINAWFKKEQKEENIERGREMLESEIKKSGIPLASILKADIIDKTAKRYNYNNFEDLLSGIGYGGLTVQKAMSRMKEEYRKTLSPEEQKAFDESNNKPKADSKPESHKPASKKQENSITVKGIENCLVKLSKCCNPVPGDDIIGFITRGHGVSVHTKNCPNLKSLQNVEGRLIDVEWQKENVDKNQTYTVEISVLGNDRNGLLIDVSTAVNELKLPIRGVNARTTQDGVAIMKLFVEISNTGQLEKLIRRLNSVQNVFEVYRSNH